MDLETVSKSELPISRTYLDSHAKMATVGTHFQMISNPNRTKEVRPFTHYYESMRQVPIMNTTMRHDDVHMGEKCMIIVRDALSVLAIDHNSIPPFAMRETGINMRTSLKFQVEDPSIDDN